MRPWGELMEREREFLDDVKYQLECQASEAASELPQGDKPGCWVSARPGDAVPPAGVIEMTCPRGHCYYRRFIDIHGRVGATGEYATRQFTCPSCRTMYKCGSFPRGPIDDDETNIWILRYRGRP